jgi:hypothetical protein
MAKVKLEFFKAAQSGNLEILRRVLEENPDAHKAFSGGMQALHHAARYNQPAAIDLLLEKGAEINSRCPNGMTAVSLATESALEALKSLIDHKADLNIPDHHGDSPLVWALQNKPQLREPMVEMLIRAGAVYGISEAICKGDIEKVRSILEADPSAVQRIRQRPDVLLRRITLGRFEGETPERVEIFKLLIAHGWPLSQETMLSEAEGCANTGRPLLAVILREYAAKPVQASATGPKAKKPRIK